MNNSVQQISSRNFEKSSVFQIVKGKYKKCTSELRSVYGQRSLKSGGVRMQCKMCFLRHDNHKAFIYQFFCKIKEENT